MERLFVIFTLLGMLLSLVLEHYHVAEPLWMWIHLVTFFFGGSYALYSSLHHLMKREIDVDLLMVLAACGAASVDAWDEGSMLLFLFSLSNVLQNYAMQRTEEAIASLLRLRPDKVTVRRGDYLVEVPLEDVLVGETMVLRPGDRIALDGEIMQGEGHFDESSLTGESMPVHKVIGSPIFAGTVNQNGSLDAEVLRLANESSLSRVINLVSEARESKARSQNFLEAFEQKYAMAILGAVGLFIFFGPQFTGLSFNQNFYRAMTLLTVASPCALVISVPAALLSAIANGARNGVLFKGGAHLEDLWKMKVVALDKTGTLTEGKPQVVNVLPAAGTTADELVRVVARAEHPSEHPLALAIRNYAEAQGIAVLEPEQFKAIPGKGVEATWEGVMTQVGTPRWFAEQGRSLPVEMQKQVDELTGEARGSLLLVHRQQWLGLVVVADKERAHVKERLAELKAVGVEHLVMLTGDSRTVAEGLGRRLGIQEVHAELLPEQKLQLIKDLQERYGPTAMVGDGINDAPALAAASIGVAMGGGGTDVAMENADVVLMRDDLGALVYALRLSRKAHQVIVQNITFALSVIVVLVVLTLTIGIPLPVGVLGHEGSTVIVVGNGLRLLTRLRDTKAGMVV